MSSTVLTLGLGALAMGAGAPVYPAQASISPQERDGLALNYQIPAGAMGAALNAFADKSGLHVLYDSHITERMRTRGLSGVYSVRDGLDLLLSGTGLSYRLSENGRAVSIMLAQAGVRMNDANPRGAEELPPIDVGSSDAAVRNSQGTGLSQGKGDRITGYNAVRASSTLKTDTPLLKTPIAVEVVTRQTMDDQQAISVNDALLSNVSGVTQGISGIELFKVRGFYNTVGNVYKNGLMEYRLRNLDTTNLQAIEVLKGPAAMLFGRGEPGGIINLVVKRPLETPYYSLQQQVKSFGGTRTTLDATGPLNDDKSVLYRFNGEFYSTDSYRNFVTDRNLFIAPTITIRPIEQFKVNIDFEYQNKTYVDDYPIFPAIGGAPANIPVSRYLGEPSIMKSTPNHFERKRIAYDATYEFLPGWSLTNRLSYYHIDTNNENLSILGVNQATGVMNRVVNFLPGYGEDSFGANVDLKGRFTTGPIEHSVLFGYDYFGTYLPVNITYFFSPISAINIYAPTYWLPENPYRGTASYGAAGQKWTGVYGQDMLSFFDDSVHVLLGGRYDWTETGSNKIGTSDYAARASYVNVYSNAFSPRVGVVYQPLPWLSLFGDFTQSFGANNGTTQNLAPLAPQKGEQYEAGVKAELLDKRLSLTMAYLTSSSPTSPIPIRRTRETRC